MRRPIGIFDSGVGGLTVMKEVMRLLPGEDLIYFGDTARVPYGNKSRETVVRYSMQIARFLTRRKVKLIIVACNTASSVALAALRKAFRVPVIGVVEPGAVEALRLTRNRKIGVIGTIGTIRSGSYQKVIKSAAPGVKVLARACPLFVPLAEEGWFDDRITLEVARKYLSDLRRMGIDTLILGCTHYPLLKETIQRAVGRKIHLVDSARQAALAARSLASRRPGRGRVSFYVSDEPSKFREVGRLFLKRRLEGVKWVKMA